MSRWRRVMGLSPPRFIECNPGPGTVYVRIEGVGVILRPKAAREFAQELTTAADDAEAGQKHAGGDEDNADGRLNGAGSD